MSEPPTAWRRLVTFFRLLPEVCANCIRFHVFFVLPRWFHAPSRIQTGTRRISLRFPDEAGIHSDFITCLLRNDYGLRRRLGDVRTILDVGANVGFFALAARARYPHTLIHVYEPNPRVLPYLHANLADTNISIYPEAVGGVPGFVAMVDEGASNEARTLACTHADSGIRQVNLATAMERLGRRVDLLKLDCEGAEWEILKQEMRWETVRNIRMEYHTWHGGTLEDVVALLAARGFRIQYTGGFNDAGGMVWAVRE
ncbi:MAG TPA: FkbM family methyltransferase [Terracidiphilus sp.]|nr:FkbM family methyltransferase [Terracidiphilus sp.]